MGNLLKILPGVLLFLFIVSGILIFSAETSSAQLEEREGCPFTLAKQAEGAGDLEFTFTLVDPDGNGEIISLTDGESLPGVLSAGLIGTITEEPAPGWFLADVVCEGMNGLVITEIEGGIEVECVEPSEEVVVCTFINLQRLANVPTLSEWGMIAAAAGLGLIGFLAVRRRRAVRA